MSHFIARGYSSPRIRVAEPAMALGWSHLGERDTDVDAIAVHQPMSDEELEFIEKVSGKVKLIVDIDDWPLGWHHEPEEELQRKHRNVCRAVELADVVTVSTQGLQGRFGGTIIRNHSPQWPEFEEGHRNHSVVWPGALRYRSADAEPRIMVQINQFLLDSGATFVHFGGEPAIEQMDNYVNLPIIGEGQYPYFLRKHSFGVILAAKTEFNECKSWLKGLEMATLGIPFVAPVWHEEHRLLNEQYGAGLIANDRYEYYDLLMDLYRNDSLYDEVKRAGLAAADALKLDNMIDQYKEAWA